MLSTLILALTLQAKVAGDYFPVKTGTTFTYEQKGNALQLTRMIGAPLDMGGVPVIPVTERQGEGAGSTTYYRVDSDQVAIVAYDVKHPLTVPMPLFRVGTGNVVWDYTGKTKTGPEGERLLAHGEAKAAGQREVLGKKVDVIEVKMVAQMGIGMTGLKFDQRAIYAKGIGLVEWTSKTTLGNSKKPDQSSYKLVDMQEGKSGG